MCSRFLYRDLYPAESQDRFIVFNNKRVPLFY
jgi:hypothetical protein